jgi:hypothetical protein
VANTYKLYYKPYSLWKASCQSEYTTEYVHEQGGLTGDSSDLFFAIYVTTLVLFIFSFITNFFYLLESEKKPVFWLLGIIQAMEFGLYISLIVIYGLTIRSLTKVDIKMM